jgi:hypothetical protein
MRKHIFKTSNIFLYLKKKSIQNMLGYWLYATHKKIFFQNMNNTITQQSQKIFTYSKIRRKLKTIHLK